jgi:glycosyltransferase involved in cell wall biosynthesis
MYAIETLNIAPNQVQVFPNGIPDSFINLPFAATPIGKEDILQIAQISAFTQRKGVQYSVIALNRILQRHQNLEVSMIGTELNGVRKSGEVHSYFKDAVRDLISVISYYYHKTLPSLLRGHHIKLFPTLSGGFGKALVEAMAGGLASITTLADGPADIIKDGCDALVIPLRDSLAIKQAVESLLSNRPRLDSLRRNAYAAA